MRLVLAIILLLLTAASVSAISPRMAASLALDDCDAQNNQDQPFLRYLYFPADAETLVIFSNALRFHVNLISRESQLAYPKLIGEGLWRVDLRDYGWDVKVFEKLADIDPYFHRQQVEVEEVVDVVARSVPRTRQVLKQRYVQYGGGLALQEYYDTEEYTDTVREEVKKVVRRNKNLPYVPNGAGQMASLVALTKSSVPIVRADWFLVQGARQIDLRNRQTGTGYYDWLGIKNRQDYFDLVGANDNQSARHQNKIRAVVGESGVTQNNRQVEREGVVNGAHWTTFEVLDQSGRGIAIQNLRAGEFLHVAEEHYAPLPNGLPATFLSDEKGVRQDSVPDKIASNDAELNTSRDKRVHVNIACMQCHAGSVLQTVADDVRPVYTGRLGVTTNSKDVSLELRRQYAANLDKFLQKDRGDYQDVYTQVTGKSPKDTVTLYSNAYSRYAYGRVTLAMAAQELGTTSDVLVKSLRDAAIRLGKSDFRLDPFLIPEQARTIPRLTFENAYGDIQDVLYGILKE